MDRGNAVRESEIVLRITSVLAMCFLVVAVAATAAPVRGLPNTSTVDGSASLLLGGFLLILTGALVIGSRRSIPTER